MPPEIYGPAGALVALAFVVGLLIKGNQPYGLVPGWLYLQERAQRVKAEEQAAKNAEALTVLAKAAANGVNGGPKRD